MAYLCTDCFEVYSEEAYSEQMDLCPKMHCKGAIVKVDELILPTIILLNQKGFFTDYCCSGHAFEGRCSAYIAFNEYFTKAIPDDVFMNIMSGLPEEWKPDISSETRKCIRCDMSKDNIVDLHKAICDANIKLLDFVCMLPSLLAPPDMPTDMPSESSKDEDVEVD